jgi:hypothetical protein
MTRVGQLRDAVNRCQIRLKIAEWNLKEADERTLNNFRSDYYRARDDMEFMQNRLDEALENGSTAFRRELVDAQAL